jgi:hypothetical protein
MNATLDVYEQLRISSARSLRLFVEKTQGMRDSAGSLLREYAFYRALMLEGKARQSPDVRRYRACMGVRTRAIRQLVQQEQALYG